MRRDDDNVVDEENLCEHCDGSARVETDNNGDIVDCPVCNGTGLKKPNAEIQRRRSRPLESLVGPGGEK